MDYKNLIRRLLTSFILIIVYFTLINYSNLFLFFVSIIYFFITVEVFKFFKKNLLILIFYILVSYLSFLIYFIYFYDLIIFNLILLFVIIFDSFSYLVGSLIGKNYIFKKISPNKTYEGLIGGFAFVNITFFMLPYVMQFNFNINYFILINIIIIFAFFGDVAQSYFKRKNDIKDSGNFLPGHGGFFDRFDSFIPVIIILNVYSIFLS